MGGSRRRQLGQPLVLGAPEGLEPTAEAWIDAEAAVGGGDVGQQAPAAAAGIKKAIAAQGRKHTGVEAPALALEDRGTIPAQPQPLEIDENGINGSGPVTGAVEIIDTQQPLTALAAGVKPADQGGAEVAEMHRPGWGGGKPTAVAPHSRINALLEQGLQVIRQAQGGADQP